MRRGGILKKLLLTLAVFIVMVVLIVGFEAYAGATARPTISTNFSRQMHDQALDRQRARLGPDAEYALNQRPAFESIMLAVREANEWTRERADEFMEEDADNDDAYDDPWRYVSLDTIYTVPEGGTPEQFERARERAIEMLTGWQRRGVFDRSSELVDLGPIARTPDEGPMFEFILPYLGVSRQLGRAQAARARLAAEAGDHETLLRAIEETFVLGRQIAGQGTLIDWLVGTAIQALGQSILLDNLLLFPVTDDAWLARADAIVQREAIERFPPLGDALRGERLFAADFIQRCYTDNGRGGGRFIPVLYAKQIGEDPPEAGNYLTPFGDTPLSNIHGRLFMGRRETDRWIDAAHVLAHEAAEAPGDQAIAADSALEQYFDAGSDWRNPAASMQAAYGRTVITDRGRRINAAGTRVVLAIERHRLQHDGAIPPTLESLGSLLPEPQRTDPFTGQAWDFQLAPVATMPNGESLLPGHHTWPYTLKSRPLPGAPTASGHYHAHNGLLITEPIQGPEFDE